MQRITEPATDGLLKILYPDRCLLCGFLGDGAICKACADVLVSPLPKPTCEICGHPATVSPCPRCRNDRPAFEYARALGLYAGLLRDAVHHLKYHDKPMLAVPLGKLMSQFARSIPHRFGDLEIDIVIAVPMDPRRQRQRGYNQAERLAIVVARELDIAYKGKVLRRRMRSRPQVGLDHEERAVNLAGGFVATSQCCDRAVLLVDDVSTTGATLRECALALKAAGTKSVYCLTLAAG